MGDSGDGAPPQKILSEKYKFKEARLTVTKSEFRDNQCFGKTCYGKDLGRLDKIALGMLAGKDCMSALTAIESAEALRKCDAAGSGMKAGTAGAAMYVIQGKKGLALIAEIRGTSSSRDRSEYYDKTDRAAIVIKNCKEVRLEKVQVAVQSPTLYKLSLSDLTVFDATKSTYLSCSNGLAKSADSEVYLSGVLCR